MRILFYLAILAATHFQWARSTIADDDTGGYLDSSEITLSPAVEQYEQARIAAIDHAMPSATSIFVPGGGGGGSGVLIDQAGFALTNFHVTAPAGTYMQCSRADGNIYDGVIVGIDPVGDLAMIQLLPLEQGAEPNFPAASIGHSMTARPGDWSFVIGNPFLLAGDLQPTVTWGMLSGVGRYQYPSGTLLEYGDCLQTDASINPGNSGGPIYDAQGNLLGIVGRCSFEKRGRVNVGVGYAISIAQAMNFAGTLRAGLIVDHATLGATVSTDPDGGVRVTNLLESCDAYRRGLRFDSEILRINNRSVTTANDVQNILTTFPAGWRIPMTFRTDGETIDTIVRLRSVHNQDELLIKMAGVSPPPPPSKDKPKPIEDSSPEQSPDDENGPDEESTPPDLQIADLENSDIPQSISDRFIERRGFANYFFNLQQQDEFAEAIKRPPWSKNLGGSSWSILGKHDDIDVEIIVSKQSTILKMNDQSIELNGGDEFLATVDSQSDAAILAPLSALYRMILDGPKQFGDTFAGGTAPLGGELPLRRVTIATDGPGEARFYNHPDDLHLEVVEWMADRDNDPAELWIDYDADGAPAKLRLRFGTEDSFDVQIRQWQVLPDAAVAS